MFTKKPFTDHLVDEVQFPSIAITFPPEMVYENWPEHTTGTFERTHPSGWTIKGKIVEDYYYWVNDFEATHPVFGRVMGNFEEALQCDSEEGLQDFVRNHPPQVWDYHDI